MRKPFSDKHTQVPSKPSFRRNLYIHDKYKHGDMLDVYKLGELGGLSEYSFFQQSHNP